MTTGTATFERIVTRSTRSSTSSVSAKAPIAARKIRKLIQHGDIAINYRPIQRLLDMAIVGVEAAPFWSSKRDGQLGLDDLRSAANIASCGLELDLHLLDRAIPNLGAALSLLPGEPWLGVPISVNSLLDQHFERKLFATLKRWGAAPDGLALCVSRMPTSIEAVASTLRLQDSGVWIVSPTPLIEVGTNKVEPDLNSIAAVNALTVSVRPTGPASSSPLISARQRSSVIVRDLHRADQVQQARDKGFGFGSGDAIGPVRPLAQLFWPNYSD